MPRALNQKASKYTPILVGTPRHLSVFINCPFDPAYSGIFDGIVLATVCCGFVPRCALEAEQVSETRIRRIVKSLKSSKYSVHDLCRCAGGGEENFARFNVPLELGIAMGERFGNEDISNWHDWLVLVPNGHTHAKFISDLAGYDPKPVEQNVENVVPAVMSWLSTREEAIVCPRPSDVLKILPEFTTERALLTQDWFGHEPWINIVRTALDVGRRRKLIV